MAPKKSKSKAPAKKLAPKKAPAKKVVAKPAPKAVAKPAVTAKPVVASYTPSAKVFAQPAARAKAPAAQNLGFVAKVWWAFAWRQYVLGFLFNAIVSIGMIGVVMAVGTIRFQVWMLTIQMDYPWFFEAFNFISGLVLSLLAVWVATHLVVKRGAARRFKTFSLAHHKPNGTPAVGFRAQFPLAVALWWRQTLMSVVFMSAAVALFAYTTQGGEFLTGPEKAYIVLVIIFFVLMNIAIVDRLVSKRHFKFFSLVVEPRTDKQA